MGFGVWGLGFRVWGLGFGVWGLGLGVGGWGLGVWGFGGLGVWGFGGLGVWGFGGLGVWGFGGLGVWAFGVWGLGVSGLGLRVEGLGCWRVGLKRRDTSHNLYLIHFCSHLPKAWVESLRGLHSLNLGFSCTIILTSPLWPYRPAVTAIRVVRHTPVRYGICNANALVRYRVYVVTELSRSCNGAATKL